MCGQAGFHRRNGKLVPKLNKLADELMLSIESRGTDATGYVALMENGKVQLQKRTHTASRFVRERDKIRTDAKTVLLHTRYATRGSARDPRNAHPVASGTVAAVHNGTITNADEIFTAFGLTRRAEVDSEVIPALIDHAGWANAEDAIDLFDGGCATAVINTDHPDEVILARTRSYPMIYGVTDELVIWASTRHAIERAWYHTYGSSFRGVFTDLPEWTVVRINGAISSKQIREVETFISPPAAAKRKKAATKKSTGSKRQRGRARRNGAKRSPLAAPKLTPAALKQLSLLQPPKRTSQRQPTLSSLSRTLADEAVEDLMGEGLTRREAEDMVYGDMLMYEQESRGWDDEYEYTGIPFGTVIA